MKNVISKSQDLDDLERSAENIANSQQQSHVDDRIQDLGVSMAEEPIPPARKSKSERPQFIGTSFVVENKVNEWMERNEKQKEQAKIPDDDLENDYLKARTYLNLFRTLDFLDLMAYALGKIIADSSHLKRDRRPPQTMKRQEILKAKKIKFEKRSPSKKDEIHKIDQKLNRVQILQLLKDGSHKVK